MQIYYIRHGQSTNNHLYAETGSDAGRVSDPGLTKIGLKQARLLAEHTASGNGKEHPQKTGSGEIYDYKLTHIYTSLMARAVKTASILARYVNLPLIGLSDFYEVGGVYLEDKETGEYNGQSGKRPAQLMSEYPELVLPENLPEAGWYSRPFESRQERLPRIKGVLEGIIARHAGTTDRIALVGHGGAYQYFLTAVMGMTDRPPVWFVINNCAITRIDHGERFDIVYTNRTVHMPAELIT